MAARKFISLMNHTLLDSQITDAKQSFGSLEFIEPPQCLKSLWSNISPYEPAISEILKPVVEWLNTTAVKDDFILIQGDFGACYLIVNYAIDSQLIPLYATTRRLSSDSIDQNDCITTQRQFKHIRFRKYGQ